MRQMTLMPGLPTQGAYGTFSGFQKTESGVEMKEAFLSTASFLKWRLVPIRYAGRLRYLNANNIFVDYKPKTPTGQELEETGYAAGPTVDPTLLKELQDTFLPRAEGITERPKNTPFINLAKPEDFTPENPLMRLAFSPEILDVALDYYDGHCRIDKLQVLYSFPVQDGPLKESQMWHLDYNDSRSFHCITYLNDVMTDDEGPFGFINKADSRRIGRGPVIRRIDDTQLRKELGDGQIEVFYGKAGESVMLNPSICYHYGSRCRTQPRIAVFTTFSSDKPFIKALPVMSKNRDKLLATAKALRPDLDPGVLEDLMRI